MKTYELNSYIVGQILKVVKCIAPSKKSIESCPVFITKLSQTSCLNKDELEDLFDFLKYIVANRLIKVKLAEVGTSGYIYQARAALECLLYLRAIYIESTYSSRSQQ